MILSLYDFIFLARKHLQKRCFLEDRHAQNLQHLSHAHLQFEALTHDGHQQVHAQRDPQLGLDRVGRVAEKHLDPQVLLDPFEKQFHLPATVIEFADRAGRQGKIVGQEHVVPLGLGIHEAYVPQQFRILAARLQTGQANRLIGSQPGGLVDFPALAHRVIHVLFGAGHKVSLLLRKAMQPHKIHSRSIRCYNPYGASSLVTRDT